ncbi:MAG: AbiV family abortive infection protein [Firmicutes bacterium]|nr:AbiV family abortive infection protein [Bacillota bacterium]
MVPKEKASMVIPEHIRHAGELLRSANLLIKAKHYQTGFALATYANESIIKGLILWSYWIGFLDGKGYESVEKASGRRHDQRQKLALILLKEMNQVVLIKKKPEKNQGHYAVMHKIKSSIPNLVNDLQKQWDVVDGTFWENAKRQALYVDWDSTIGRVPDPLNWEALALEARRIARKHLDYLREINKPYNTRRFLRHGKEIKRLVQEYMAANFSNEEQSF